MTTSRGDIALIHSNELLVVRDDRLPLPEPPVVEPAPVERPDLGGKGDIAWLGGVGVATALVTAIGLGSATARTQVEGILAAQAQGVDLPAQASTPRGTALAWALPDAWARVTDGYDRWSTVVGAGREFALLSHVAAAMLLWLLCRRFALSRPAATAAVALWVASPLVLETSRLWTPAALASPWVLLAFVLAARTNSPLPWRLAALLALLVATALSPASLIFIPGVVALLWREVDLDDRPRLFTLPVVVAVAALLGFAVISAASGYWPAGGWSSRLADTLALHTSTDATGRTLHHWMVTDAILPVAGLAAATVALRQRTRRLAGQVLVTAVAVLAGMSPSDALNVLPFCALLSVSAVAVLIKRARSPQSAPGALAAPPHRSQGYRAMTACALACLALVLALATWPLRLLDLGSGGGDRPAQAAVSWLATQGQRDGVIVADRSLQADLVLRGFSPARVLDIAQYDRLGQRAPGADYVVTSTADARALPAALARTAVVRSFGEGSQRIDVRRVAGATPAVAAPKPAPPVTAPPSPDARAQAQRQAAGDELASNPALQFTPKAKAQLVGGEVDSRVMTALALLASQTPLTVSSFSPQPGRGPDLRNVTLSRLADTPVRPGAAAVQRVVDILDAQRVTYRPARVVVARDALTFGYSGTDG